MSFPITCTACHKTFTISGEIYEKKVAGRVVTIKCKSCSHGIRVDGTKGAGAATGSVPAPALTPAVPAPTTEPVWAVDYPDGQDREFTLAEVVAELERGSISGSTLVWRDGMAEWLELAQVSELASELSKIEAKKAVKAQADAKSRPQPKPEANRPPEPVHTPRAPMPTVTGLGGLPGATGNSKPRAQQPSSPGLAPRAQQPSSPGLAPRAQQPSSPGLAPRAQQPSSPALAPRAPSSSDLTPRVQQPSSPDLTPRVQPVFPKPAFAPPAAAVAPTLGTSAPAAAAFVPSPAPELIPPLPASVAKVVSKPPVVESVPAFPMAAANAAPAFGALPSVVAPHASVEWPEAKKKTPFIIMGVIAAALVVGGIVFVMLNKDDVPVPTPITAAPASTAAPATTTTRTGGLPSPITTLPGAETASGSDPIAATPGAGFAELFAAGARKAESKGASVSPTARFDPAATKAPLAQAATEAQACKQVGGPSGKVSVMVSFDPSGKAAGAVITDAPFAGTATATCITATFKRATIPPFSGLPGTVSKTFSIL